MAIQFDRLQELMKKENLRFFIAPDEPVLQFKIAGLYGKYDIMMHLQEDGRFLQFRTVAYLQCPADHPQLAAVLKLLAYANYQKRFVKFGWDPRDGEIMAYADLWLMDNGVTEEQFHCMLGTYMPTIDAAALRIGKTIETGIDPGEPAPPNHAPGLAVGGGPGTSPGGGTTPIKEI